MRNTWLVITTHTHTQKNTEMKESEYHVGIMRLSNHCPPLTQSYTICFHIRCNLSTFGMGNINQQMIPMTSSGPGFTKEMDDLLIHQSNYEVKINHQISDTGLSVIPECSHRRWCTFQKVRNVISLGPEARLRLGRPPPQQACMGVTDTRPGIQSG